MFVQSQSTVRTLCAMAMFSAALGPTAIATGAIFYDDRIAFETDQPVTETHSFEVPFDSAPSVSFTEFTVTEDSEGPTVSSRADYVSDGILALGFTWNGQGYLEFRFDVPTTTFAIDILDFGTCCDSRELTVTTDPPMFEKVVAVGNQSERGNVQFFGVVTDEPFQVIRFASTAVNDIELINFDRLQYRLIPEPHGAAYLLPFAACVFGLGGRERRRRRQQAPVVDNGDH